MTKTSIVITAHVVVFVTMVLMSFMNIILEQVLDPEKNDAMIFGFFRLCLTSVVFPFVMIFSMQQKDFDNWKKYNLWIYLISGGVFGIFFNQIGFIIGLEWTNADISAIFQPLSAIIAAIIGISLGLERCTGMKGLGFILSIGGVIGSLFLNGINSNGNSVKGDIFLTVGITGNAIFLFCQKPILEYFSPTFITACAMWSGTLATFFATLTRFDKFAEFEWNLKVIGALAYCSLICGVLGYSAFSWANVHIDGSLVSIYNVVQPPVTDILAYFILNEPLSMYTIGGCGFVIIGLIIVVHQSYFESLEKYEGDPPVINESLLESSDVDVVITSKAEPI